MKQIENDIKGIEFKIEPNNTYYLGLITSDEAHASVLYNKLIGIINLKYDYIRPSSVLLNIHNTSYDEVMRINLWLNNDIEMLMKCIDDKAVMYVFASYQTQTHSSNLLGQYIPVSF